MTHIMQKARQAGIESLFVHHKQAIYLLEQLLKSQQKLLQNQPRLVLMPTKKQKHLSRKLGLLRMKWLLALLVLELLKL